jgi:hypothetical protein
MANSQLFDNGLTDTLFKDGGFRPTFGVAATGSLLIVGNQGAGQVTIGSDVIDLSVDSSAPFPDNSIRLDSVVYGSSTISAYDLMFTLDSFIHGNSALVPGTSFESRTFSTPVTSNTSGVDTVIVTATFAGEDGNLIATNTTLGLSGWAAATLTGGIDGAK